MKNRYKVLKNPNFRNYFLGDIITCFGNGMSFIGLNWYVREATGINGSVGLLMIVYLISNLMIFPIAGTLVDFFKRRTIMISLNFFRGVFVTAIACLLFWDMSKMSFFYVLAAINGACSLVYQAGTRALMQELLDKDDLILGNSLKEISFQIGLFTAAGVAGCIYKFGGVKTILSINAAVFFISNFFLFKIKYVPVRSISNGKSFVENFWDGIGYLSENKAVWLYGIAMFIPFVATMSINVILPGYTLEYLSGDSVTFGLADMSYGIGAFFSGFAVTYVTGRFSRNTMIWLFFILSISTLCYLTVNMSIYGLFAALVLIGIGNSSLRIVMQALIMEIVPEITFGRVMSVWIAISSIMQIISVYFTSRLMDVYPENMSFIWLMVVMSVGLVLSTNMTPRIVKQVTLMNTN